jgi:hypothetical protein
VVTERVRLLDMAGTLGQADVRPRLAIIERPDGRETLFGEDGRIGVSRTRFVLRLLLCNDGSEALRDAAVNILVPKACTVEPFGDSGLRRVGSCRSDKLVPGSFVTANILAVERDYPPALPVRHYAVVTLPGPGRWPIFVVVAGDAPIAWASRVLVEFCAPASYSRLRTSLPQGSSRHAS